MLLSVKPDASPGIPYLERGKENALVIESSGDLIIDIVIDRLDLLSKTLLSDEDLSAVDLVQFGYCDVVRLFVKNEPHSRAKLDEGRVRLIMSIGLVDQVMARILFSPQNHKEIEYWFRIPSKPGMGFTQNQTDELCKTVQEFGDGHVSFDVQGWDFSVQQWELDAEAESRILLASAEDTTFATVVRNYYFTYGRSVFALSDGSLFAQTIPGIVKSGGYTTSSSNSRILCRTANIIGVTKIMANGDDHVCVPTDDYVEKMLTHGHVVKREKVNLDFNFCSHEYKFDGTCYTSNELKITFSLLNKAGPVEDRLDLYRDWLLDMVDHPSLEYWKNIIISSGYLE